MAGLDAQRAREVVRRGDTGHAPIFDHEHAAGACSGREGRCPVERGFAMQADQRVIHGVLDRGIGG